MTGELDVLAGGLLEFSLATNPQISFDQRLKAGEVVLLQSDEFWVRELMESCKEVACESMASKTIQRQANINFNLTTLSCHMRLFAMLRASKEKG